LAANALSATGAIHVSVNGVNGSQVRASTPRGQLIANYVGEISLIEPDEETRTMGTLCLPVVRLSSWAV
jgi:hypothetical protein